MHSNRAVINNYAYVKFACILIQRNNKSFRKYKHDIYQTFAR